MNIATLLVESGLVWSSFVRALVVSIPLLFVRSAPCEVAAGPPRPRDLAHRDASFGVNFEFFRCPPSHTTWKPTKERLLTSTMAPFQELPSALLQEIFLYLPDAQGLCRLQACCQDFRVAASTDGLWDRLHRRRWTQSCAQLESYDQSEYKRRHILDQGVISLLRESIQDPDCREENMLNIVRFGSDATDVCWKISISQEEAPELCSLATCALRMLNCSDVIEQLRVSVSYEYSDVEGSEEIAILVSRMFCELDSCASAGNACSQGIRERLDMIATTVQDRLSTSHSIEDQVQAVNTVLFDEMGFVCNEESDFRNSLLQTALETRTTTPITLALVYAYVCHRVGISVDILYLSWDCFVVKIPALDDYYIDVSGHGKRLTTLDCHQILVSEGMRPSSTLFLEPIKWMHISILTIFDLHCSLMQVRPLPPYLKILTVKAMRTLLDNPPLSVEEYFRVMNQDFTHPSDW